MLFRDGEQLTLRGVSTDNTEKWIINTLKEIKSQKRVYVFKSTMKPDMLTDENGRPHTDHRFCSIPRNTMHTNADTGIRESWDIRTKASSFRRNPDGTSTLHREPPFIVKTDGTFFDSEKHTEEIFFLLHLSEAITNRHIYLEDKVAEAKALDEELMLQDMAYNMISSPASAIRWQ